MIQDVVEIEQLLYRYCHAVDRGTLDEILDTFHRDAILLPRYQGDATFEGKPSIRAWYEVFLQTERARAHSVRHTISTPMIQVDGARASSVCYLDVDGVVRDGGEAFQLLGRYEDELVKDGARWWLAKRSIIARVTTHWLPLCPPDRRRELRGAGRLRPRDGEISAQSDPGAAGHRAARSGAAPLEAAQWPVRRSRQNALYRCSEEHGPKVRSPGSIPLRSITNSVPVGAPPGVR
ncbi:MAG: nuclear transport factor 2 family protein [Deltaproteobacteria bacterium]|nr:nuclear transport factor 2 family protein [Deltaproteobacteria bacterium]